MSAFAAARRRGPSYGTVIAITVVLGIIVLLFATGRLEARKWQPFLEPSTWRFLGEGLLVTLIVAGVALVLSTAFGIVLGVVRSGLFGPLGWLVSGAIELVRATPILAILLIVTIVMLRLRLSSEAIFAGIIGLTIYNSAVIGEIVRAGILSIPRGEVEAARSLGLSYLETMRSVVLPQALSRMTPALVSQLITLIKDTSLLFIIAAPELLSFGRSFYNFYGNLLETYIVIACIFFAINYPLSRFSRRLETRRPADERLHIIGEEDQTLVPVITMSHPKA
ncbi:MAG: amino acid ABC transporter permease [Chloroflexi bacterium]|nr:amino acid ABC transporter permease [Chloroflexota bacterium]